MASWSIVTPIVARLAPLLMAADAVWGLSPPVRGAAGSTSKGLVVQRLLVSVTPDGSGLTALEQFAPLTRMFPGEMLCVTDTFDSVSRSQAQR
jgi:hypothetical protein